MRLAHGKLLPTAHGLRRVNHSQGACVRLAHRSPAGASRPPTASRPPARPARRPISGISRVHHLLWSSPKSTIEENGYFRKWLQIASLRKFASKGNHYCTKTLYIVYVVCNVYLMTLHENPVRWRTYRKWASMCARCYNPSHPAYPYYGGRGILVCQEWVGRGGFDRFLDHMGDAPEGLTLDRIDNSKGYEPGNCRWASWKDQAANRRHVGPQINPNSLRQRSIAAGLPYYVVYQRVKIFDWTEERALSTPVGPKGRRVGWRKTQTS